MIESSSESDNEPEEPQEEEPEEDSDSDSMLSPSPRSPHLTDNGEDLVEEEQDQDVDMELDPYEEAIMAWEEKRQQSTDWCSVPYKYLECINGDPVHLKSLTPWAAKKSLMLFVTRMVISTIANKKADLRGAITTNLQKND